MSNLHPIPAMKINADGGSVFEIFPGQVGRYQEGRVSNPAVGQGHLKETGIIDTETMTMPVNYRLDADIEHLELQIRSIALAILNDKVVLPASPIAPGSYRAVIGQEGDYLSLQCFSWPHERRMMGNCAYYTDGALLEGTLGSADHPYQAGLECLTKIAEVLSSCGYAFEFNTVEQFNSDYMVADLPEWCPASDYKPVSVVKKGYRITEAPSTIKVSACWAEQIEMEARKALAANRSSGATSIMA